MIELFAAATTDHIASPRLAPAERAEPSASVLDVDHLARMTLGDRSLQKEVLALFKRQAPRLIGRMLDAQPEAVAPLAHTMLGSARGIGAWQVAKAAEAVELASGRKDCTALPRATARLAAAVDEANATIASLLATP